MNINEGRRRGLFLYLTTTTTKKRDLMFAFCKLKMRK